MPARRRKYRPINNTDCCWRSLREDNGTRSWASCGVARSRHMHMITVVCGASLWSDVTFTMRRQPLLDHFPTPSFPPSTERSDIWPTVSGESGGSARPLNYMMPATTPPLGFPPPFESYVPGSSRAMWRKGQLVSGPGLYELHYTYFRQPAISSSGQTG